jgi:hypothetical protein
MLVLLAMTGCASETAAPSRTATPSHQVVHVEASWVVLYHNLHDLKANSDAIVVATILQAKESTMNRGSVTTDFVVQIDRLVLDKKGLLTSPTFLLHQGGGVIKETTYIIDDDPLFQVKEQAVLFLKQNEAPLFFVTGGPSGRFRLQNGQVSPANAAEGVAMQTTNLEAFLAQVAQA